MSGNGKEVPKICCSMMLYALMDGKFSVSYINGYRRLTLGDYAITYCPYCGDEIIYNDAYDNDCTNYNHRRWIVKDTEVEE
jgi:hypothetical protein